MAHEKVYGICENKCFVEVSTKNEVTEELNEVTEELNEVTEELNEVTNMFNVITIPSDSVDTFLELGTNLPFMTEIINLKSSSITLTFTKPEDVESVNLCFGYIKSTTSLTEINRNVTSSYSLTLETNRRMIIFGNV